MTRDITGYVIGDITGDITTLGIYIYNYMSGLAKGNSLPCLLG